MVMSFLKSSASSILLLSLKAHAQDPNQITMTMYTDKETFDAATVGTGTVKLEDFSMVPPQPVFANELTQLGELTAYDERSFGAGQMDVLEGGDVALDDSMHLSMIVDGEGNRCEVYFPNASKVFSFGARFKIPNYGDKPSLTINSVTFEDALNLNETVFRGFVSSEEITKLTIHNQYENAAFLGMDNITWVEQSSDGYLGCFIDEAARALEITQPGTGYSVDDCKAACAAYAYAGRQWKGQCFCGNGNYSIYGPVESPCDCQGDNVGSWKMCVYETSSA